MRGKAKLVLGIGGGLGLLALLGARARAAPSLKGEISMLTAPGEAVEGDTVTVWVRFQNSGETEGNFFSSVLVNGEEVMTTPPNTLAPGQDALYAAQFTMPGTDVRVKTSVYHQVDSQEKYALDDSKEATVALALLPVEGRYPPCDSWGDVNGDGVITVEDAEEVQRFLSGENLALDALARACVMGVGVVEQHAADYIRRYALGENVTFPTCQIGLVSILLGVAQRNAPDQADGFLVYLTAYTDPLHPVWQQNSSIIPLNSSHIFFGIPLGLKYELAFVFLKDRSVVGDIISNNYTELTHGVWYIADYNTKSIVEEA